MRLVDRFRTPPAARRQEDLAVTLLPDEPRVSEPDDGGSRGRYRNTTLRSHLRDTDGVVRQGQDVYGLQIVRGPCCKHDSSHKVSLLLL